MAAQLEWQEQRQGLKRSADGHKAHSRRVVARLEEAIVEAEEWCPKDFCPTLRELCDASEDVVKSIGTGIELMDRYDSVYEGKFQELHGFKDQVDFAVRHRDFITRFEVRVHAGFQNLPKYQQALDAGAQELRQVPDALGLLASMKEAEEFDNQSVQALWITPGNKLMREAWYEEVVRQGLQVDEYVAVRQFKGLTNLYFHDKGTKPADALRVLKSSLPVPAGYAQYKQPLIKLLEALSRFAARGQ